MSNYIFGSMQERERLASSIMATIPCLGIATLDENTFSWYMRNMFHATPQQNDTTMILRWTIPSGLQYIAKDKTYRVRIAGASPEEDQAIDEFESMMIIRDLSRQRPGVQYAFVESGGNETRVVKNSFIEQRARQDHVFYVDPFNNVRDSGILFLPDFHQIWHQPPHLRALKETIIAVDSSTSNTVNKVILSFPPGSDIPVEIQTLMYVDLFDSPDVEEFQRLIFFWLEEQADQANQTQRRYQFERLGFSTGDITIDDAAKVQNFLNPNDKLDKTTEEWTVEEVAIAITNLAQSLTGLSWSEGCHTLVMAYQNVGFLDVSEVQQAKITYLNSHQALSVHHPDTLPSYDDVGGYQAIKDYVSRHMSMFKSGSKERAQALGVPNFKGCLLLGVPGTGKSLIARATAKESGMLACELDIGKVMDKFVGGSESNMERVKDIMEKAAGNHGLVVIMDEVEKQLAGTNNAGASDAGTSSRVHRSFLTWLNDRTKPVIIFMTANQIDQIPPEFMRPGRIDAIFFFDLPGAEAREAILKVHLDKFPEVPKTLDMHDTALHKLNRFTGAEIEQLVKECVMAILHGEDDSISDCLIDKIVPKMKIQADTHRVQIDELRQRAKDFMLADEDVPEDSTCLTTSGNRGSILSRRPVPDFDLDSEVELDLESEGEEN